MKKYMHARLKKEFPNPPMPIEELRKQIAEDKRTEPGKKLLSKFKKA